MLKNTLAAESKNWANHLTTLGAAYCNNPKNNCHGANNENIAYACGGCMTLDSMAQLWANKKVKFDAGQGSGPGIGHWTAMVWKSTREVGCGISSNGETNFLVCRYSRGQRSVEGTSEPSSYLHNGEWEPMETVFRIFCVKEDSTIK
jgi:hypothetical protein